MTISYPLAFPTHTGVRSISIRQQTVSKITESPFTLKQQVIVHTGQRWEASIELPPMTHANARQWIAWLSSLRGHQGSFLMGDPLGVTPAGSAGGTPVVDGASQTGGSLNITGATASQTGWLKAGDYIQLGSGETTTLHMVLADADSDVSGDVTVDIWPDLRSSPSDAATVVVSAAKGLWRLTSNNIGWDADHASIYGLSFSVVEALS